MEGGKVIPLLLRNEACDPRANNTPLSAKIVIHVGPSKLQMRKVVGTVSNLFCTIPWTVQVWRVNEEMLGEPNKPHPAAHNQY